MDTSAMEPLLYVVALGVGLLSGHSWNGYKGNRRR